jgi:hypothetical protein
MLGRMHVGIPRASILFWLNHDSRRNLVVNNASTDATRAVAEEIPHIRVVDERRKDLVVARETGRRRPGWSALSAASTAIPI